MDAPNARLHDPKSDAPSRGTAGSAALPEPIDVPLGPPGVDAPEGERLPAMQGPAREGAPAISAISDVTFPNETLVVTGAGLAGARLRVWAGGRLADVEPLRTAADRMQAVVPRDLPTAVMLVWPVRGEAMGAPIRVNGATLWWAWPARARACASGQTVRVFGKSLTLGDASPHVYLRGPGRSEWLRVVGSNPYHLEAALPDDLAAGTYCVWAHNGSGGAWGWSEAASFDVVAAPDEAALEEFRVDGFAAARTDGNDWEAITAAVHAAEEAGGGIVVFGPRAYHVDRPVTIAGDGPHGIHLVGAGMGEHRWSNAPAPDDHKVEHTLSAAFTAIEPLPDQPSPPELVRLTRRYSSVRDMTLLNHADGAKQRCLGVCAHDVVVERVRAIVVDERPRFEGWDVPEDQVTQAQYQQRLQDEGVMRIDAPGKANIVVRHCEFHHPGAGIDTPRLRGKLHHHPDSAPCPPGTDYIQIADCCFRGYFDGRLEPYMKDRRWQGLRGWLNMAWVNNNCRNVIVERCDLAGADKAHFKVMTRSLNHVNTSIRELYLAHNTGHDLAPTSMSPGYHENKGEQFLFHLMYPQGGLFDVVDASDDSVTVDPSDPRYGPGDGRRPAVDFNGLEFGAVPGDADVNPTHWVVFLCAGRGAGQYRVVRECKRRAGRAVLRLEEPWRVAPDATSRLTLNAAYRRIIIYGNEIDGGFSDHRIKSHGVTFWANSFENVIAGNTYRNLAGGVVINTFYRCPTGWNLTRDNRIENMRGNGGDTVFPGKAAFYVDHVRALSPAAEDRVWYSVGNIARSNRCSGADVVAFLHRPDYARIDPSNPNLPEATRELLLMPRGDNTVVNYEYPDTPNGGIMMSVVENNLFDTADEGIVISSPVNWLLLRDNEVRLSDPAQPVIVDESAGRGEARGARDVLVVSDELVMGA